MGGGSGSWTHVHPRLIHVNVWQKPLQYCKVISLQLKKKRWSGICLQCWRPGLGRSPGEEMATHSNILAWKIPGTEGPGRLQSMGSQRVGYNWATEHREQIAINNVVVVSGEQQRDTVRHIHVDVQTLLIDKDSVILLCIPLYSRLPHFIFYFQHSPVS